MVFDKHHVTPLGIQTLHPGFDAAKSHKSHITGFYQMKTGLREKVSSEGSVLVSQILR